MQENENYEKLKDGTKTFLQIITSNELYYGLFLLIVMIIAIKLIDLLYRPFKKKNLALAAFIKGCLKVFVVITIGMRILALIPGLDDFTSQILMSSSLIVVVLGFIFQEGLSNIVHGFILSIFRPFKIGDRVSITIDGESITGHVEQVNARHTVIRNIINSAHIIVPNAKLDTCVISNNYYDGNMTSSSFLDLSITYESNLEKALQIMTEEIMAHPLVAAAREQKGITDPPTVLVRELGDSGISLRGVVQTSTVEENFVTCSDLRRKLVHVFAEDPEIDIAYPHMQIISK